MLEVYGWGESCQDELSIRLDEDAEEDEDDAI